MATPLIGNASCNTLAILAVCAVLTLSGPATAQKFITTEQQQSTAIQVSQSGVPLGDLSPDAPSSYTVKVGDTLWGISGLYLKSPWRWPELWGMNLSDIQNPHRIYPGQTLVLVTQNGVARLRLKASSDSPNAPDVGLPTVRLSPHTRVENLKPHALATLKPHLIEPFLAEPVIVDEASFNAAPRIVAAQDNRVLLTRGDRAYARGPAGAPLLDDVGRRQQKFRIFRNATPLKDPLTGEVLGFEAQYVGRALLVQSESLATGGKEIVPATIDIVDAKEEMRMGDRLLPEPVQRLQNYVPHAATGPMDARIVSVYGSAVANAAQNQVVTINKGIRDGITSGQVLAILKDGVRVLDKTDAALTPLKLPDERNGLLMVFLPYDKVSYALVLDITSGVKVGDRLINPR